MKKLIITLIVVFAIQTISRAQDYGTGIGLRGGLASGLTVKHFLSENAALEGIVSTRWKGFNLTGLYEIHNRAFNTNRLNWYYGFGGHIGFWNGHKNHPWFDDNKNYTVIGVDAILGLEYNFEEIPINISIDWKPAYNLTGYSGFWGDSAGLSIRYIF